MCEDEGVLEYQVDEEDNEDKENNAENTNVDKDHVDDAEVFK